MGLSSKLCIFDVIELEGHILSVPVQVQTVFDNLSQRGHNMLEFMLNDVKLIYQQLAKTGVQYQKDSEFINECLIETILISHLFCIIQK